MNVRDAHSKVIDFLRPSLNRQTGLLWLHVNRYFYLMVLLDRWYTDNTLKERINIVDMSDIFKYSYCSSCNSKSNIQALISKILYTDFLMLHYQVYCTNPHYMWRIQSLFFHQCCNYALLFHWWVQQSHTYFQCIVWTLNFLEKF